jgi:16S rRNA (guanine527-N7)-methyltransferase
MKLGPNYERYAELLIEWNKKINLVAPSTLSDLWSRHFLDSAQLYGLLPPKTQNLVDLGSGAGFPGLVLALMGVPEVHLIESIGKKARFLEAVAAELAPNVTVHHARIEKFRHIRANWSRLGLDGLPIFCLWRPLSEKRLSGTVFKGPKGRCGIDRGP